MKVKIIDFDSNFAVCNYRDLDGYNAYGYLHSYEINDLKLPIKEKVKLVMSLRRMLCMNPAEILC